MTRPGERIADTTTGRMRPPRRADRGRRDETRQAMNFDKTSKIEKAAARDSSRYAINCVYLDTAKGRLVATDGSILAIVPCEIADDDADGLIPLEAIDRARKLAIGGIVRAKCNGKAEQSDGSSFQRPDHRFPDYSGIIPKEAGSVRVSLNADSLLRLAQALGGKTVTLEIGEPGTPIRVRPCLDGIEGAFGLIMPISGG